MLSCHIKIVNINAKLIMPHKSLLLFNYKSNILEEYIEKGK